MNPTLIATFEISKKYEYLPEKKNTHTHTLRSEILERPQTAFDIICESRRLIADGSIDDSTSMRIRIF